jgi:deoxyadenosine/deoxycytidine kinase
MPEQPFIITIGGNIGCGKSTVIEELNDLLGGSCTVVPEPIHEWGSWIDLFYTNQSKYALGFQMKILHSFLRCLRGADLSKPIITERSPTDSLEVFSKVLYDDKIMNHLEYNLYKEYVEDVGWKPNVYIYLQTTPDVCIQRIHQRARGCESGMDEEYIKKLGDAYNKMHVKCGMIHIVNANQSKEKVSQEVYQIISNLMLAQTQVRV